MEVESSQEHIKVNSAQYLLEGLGHNPQNAGARKYIVQQDDSQADKQSGKVPITSKLASEVKVTGLRQTNLSFMSAGGAALRGQYQWEPD
eukprot:3099089-Heterocapsa_arctica.AAC.1